MAALLAVERATLGDIPYSLETVLGVIQRDEHHGYVARSHGHIVGFCSCFETASDAGTRLEIDLLGVVASHRRRGMATAMIRTCICDALARGTRRFRAVVAEGNIASKSAFHRAGLTAAAPPHTLLILDTQATAPIVALPGNWSWQFSREGHIRALLPNTAFSADGHGKEVHWISGPRQQVSAIATCLRVSTIAYEGVWIEDMVGNEPQAITALGIALGRYGRQPRVSRIGYLMPSSDSREHLDALLSAGYRRIGAYVVLEAEAP